ncbi:MBOAT family O-acyltransferase [Butyrivibrio sp. NC2007]|uniref:MBOAT family O-acyltransferase n=1 Tax=Butyrivibrio sp. NC2007 TaxID=1280683 RepID=UPI0003B4DBD8|nr:MBOAT family O-acyltransferase [Butyrivibrio sp. NC2007]
MVNFSDLNFIFRFLPVFLVAFYLTPVRFRTWTLLFGSLLFYAVGDLRMFPALLAAVIVNFLFAKAQFGEKSKSLLFFVLAIDAGMLIEFKILGQYVDKSLLPIGISFYIFKMISYQMDVYRGKVEKDASFVDVAAYFCMFPQVVSGPIMRFDKYLENTALREKTSLSQIAESIEDGLRFFVAGLAMKVLLADHLAMLWKDIGTIGYESISTPLAWLGAVTYSLELYFDFWGYSLMAAGIGVMIGFPFITNFDHPYGSGSVSEFYRRWHATLGSWFRDYIYIPLGGSRKGEARTVFNLLVVWLVTGFWHGITLNFIIWGLSLCFLIICERLFVLKRFPAPLSKFVGKVNVLILIPLTWVVFAISDFDMLGTYFSRLFPFTGSGIAVNQGDFLKNIGIYWTVLLPSLILLIPKVYDFWVNRRNRWIFNILWLILFWACIYSLAGAAGNPFMYFKF